MLCCIIDSCIVISSIMVGEAERSSEGGARMVSGSLIFPVRVSMAALRAAVSSLDAQ
jgi:hypothetical protein